MFTGIIESLGRVKEVINKGSNCTFFIESQISEELKVDQSVSHNGVCLTVEETGPGWHRVTAIEETLKKTSLVHWRKDTLVNIERCVKMDSRLDGHLVQGHIDTTGICIKKEVKKGSWEFEFEFPKKFAELIIEKGSICVNGISLTAFKVGKKKFRVAIIPYTFDHTNMQSMQIDEVVNLEFDVVGKYILRSIKIAKNR
ncbi:MAG: riboflavin synthase [Bacteroidetes bacterium]|nr:riboflavin synthase [Bacteroidota bacterium]